jgi:hypothetical protein
VGPKVGGELRGKALLAILYSFFAVLAYLAYRFEWRFGLAAIIATAHDIILTIGFIALMRLEVSLVVVGAVLSMVGYSLNDTIIIFDRVRENLRKYKRDHFADILNRSVNETLPRSILTHWTTLATLTALAVFGGEVIRPFALVMFFGVFLEPSRRSHREPRLMGGAEVARRRRGASSQAPVARRAGDAVQADTAVLVDTHCRWPSPRTVRPSDAPGPLKSSTSSSSASHPGRSSGTVHGETPALRRPRRAPV